METKNQIKQPTKDSVINFQNNNEGKVVQKDLRKLVEDSSKHPYCAIGKIISYARDPATKMMIPKLGTGCIVARNLVLTSLHVIAYQPTPKNPKLFRSMACQVIFYPEVKGVIKKQDELGQGIKVINAIYDHQYFSRMSKQISKFDFVLLQLEQNNLIQQDQIMGLNFNYDFQKMKSKLIKISGYSGRPFDYQNRQYFEQNPPSALLEKYFLTYKHTTYEGNSGGPVLLKQDDGTYSVIGVHKGSKGQHNYCVLISSLKNSKHIFGQIIEENGLYKKWKDICSDWHIKLREEIVKLDGKNNKLDIQNINWLKNENLTLKMENSLMKNEILSLKQKLLYSQQNQKLNNQKISNLQKEVQFLNKMIINLQNNMTNMTARMEPTNNSKDLPTSKIKIDWPKKLLEQSSILGKQGLQLLIKWLRNPISEIVLQFKASSNGFKMNKYFGKCGDLTNTVIIAKTTKGKIIGGYTPLSFNPSANWTQKYNYQLIKDDSNSSFLFSLSEKHKFSLNKDKYAIQRWKDKRYIAFYDTLIIRDNSNSQKQNDYDNNRFYLDSDKYNTLKYKPELPWSKQGYLKITGSQNQYFLTQQWQVYQVFFQRMNSFNE